jgi:hypothetical protein
MRSRWLAAVLLMGGGMAYADDYSPPPPPPIASPITDHVALRAAFSWARVSTSGHVDPQVGVPGTEFNAEQLLGLPDKAYQPRIELIFRLEERSRLRVNFLDVRREGDATVSQTLVFGQQTYLPGTAVHSELDWRQEDFTYTYSFLRGEHYELGAGIGAHLVEAEAITVVPDTPRRTDFSGATPFATVALDGTWRFARHWALTARGQYMKVTINSDSGALGIYHADVQYRWRYNVAFGAGYEREQMRFDLTRGSPSGEVTMNVAGPEAFARVSF